MHLFSYNADVEGRSSAAAGNLHDSECFSVMEFGVGQESNNFLTEKMTLDSFHVMKDRYDRHQIVIMMHQNCHISLPEPVICIYLSLQFCCC